MTSTVVFHFSNASVETLGSLMLLLVTVACEVMPSVEQELNREWYVAIATVLSLVCLKDEDFYPPDGAHHITAALYSIGVYDTPMEVFFRILGQTLGVVVGWLIASQLDLSHAKPFHAKTSVGVICTIEALGTLLETLTFVYLLVPLLTVKQPNSNVWRLKPKADLETHTPSTERLLCVAMVLVVLHWTLFSVFGADLQPAVTLVLAVLRGDTLDVTIGRILAQVVGTGVACFYSKFYVQRYLDRLGRPQSRVPTEVRPLLRPSSSQSLNSAAVLRSLSTLST